MFTILHKIKHVCNYLLKKIGLYDVFHKTIIKLFSKREILSRKYLYGKGIEIGALHTPLALFNKAKAIYIDRLDNKGLRNHYPELNKFSFVPVGFVEDGEVLKSIKSNSQDFLIANHFIEHCENPIATIKNHLRVLKIGGILYYAVPDKRYTFDTVRELTTFIHLKHDYEKGIIQSRKNHYNEWAKEILQLTGQDALQKARVLQKTKYSIHFHVWTMDSFKSMLKNIKSTYHFPFEIVTIIPNINEFIVILKKV